jgi:autotransporter-associated beta strand protein
VAGPGALTVTTSSTGPGLAALEVAAPGITTISAPLVLGAASGFQAATIAAGASLRVTSDISGNAGIVKQGFGTLTLSGNNTFAGGIDHSVQDGTAASTLNINSPTALGTGTFVVGTGNNGVTIDNTSGAALTLSTNNAIATKVNAIINFTGTNDLNLGTGAVTLVGSTATFRVNGGTLTLGGNIGQDAAGRGLTKSGAGTLVLNGTHSYTGTTTVNGGVLRVNGALGASAVTVSSTGRGLFLPMRPRSAARGVRSRSPRRAP